MQLNITIVDYKWNNKAHTDIFLLYRALLFLLFHI